MGLSPFFDYGVPDASPESEPAPVFLGDASTEDWRQLLAVAEHRRFDVGEQLIEAGEQSRAFYIVGLGELEVLAPGKGGRLQRIALIGQQSIFGEQAFFDGRPRSATVCATQPGELYGITPEAFEVLAARAPDLARAALFDLGRILSLRLRSATGHLFKGRR